MSYILNALKHSENERNRGEIPHIDSQPEFVAAAPTRLAERSWKWLALSALMVLLIGLAWLGIGSREVVQSEPAAAESATSQAPVAAPSAPAQPLAQNQAQDQAPGLPALQGMAGVRIRLEDEAAAEASVAGVAPVLADAKRESPRIVLPLPISRGAVAQPSVATTPVAAREARSEAAPLPAVADAPAAETLEGVRHWKTLPPEVQKGLRELVFSAHIYSTQAANRFVRVSGRTLHEGDALNGELKLQRITRDGVVLGHGAEQYWYGVN